MIYCTYCGKELEDTAAFCSACGKRIAMPGMQTDPTAESGNAVLADSELTRLLDKESRSHSSKLQYQIGDSYFSGTNGARKDYEKAVFWLEKSAEQGNDMAQYALACCYTNGLGVEKDEDKAFDLYSKAAEQGNVSACFSLAQCYEDGKGVNWDLFKAFSLYLKLLLEGESQAEKKIRDLYDKEENIPVSLPDDFKEAHVKSIPKDITLIGVKGSLGGFYTDDISIIAEKVIHCKSVPVKEDANYQKSNLEELGVFEIKSDIAQIHHDLFHFPITIKSGEVLVYSVKADEEKDCSIKIFNYATDRGNFTLYEWNEPLYIESDSNGLYSSLKFRSDVSRDMKNSLVKQDWEKFRVASGMYSDASATYRDAKEEAKAEKALLERAHRDFVTDIIWCIIGFGIIAAIFVPIWRWALSW
ncbi:MAG: SEL1-like repeat protein [Treponema sp.]|nr:SEL1-like repeat protein [Treponema sp.]